MGQGHSVAGIEACNLLVGNMLPNQTERYDTSERGLTRFVNDFYSYAIRPDGTPASPLGSHVGPNTAGGISEGGYLGFAELQYVHMPLPGESLVAFLSDGAFEEQRGSDWAPRWWRAEDCGYVSPIMILNGQRIEQRSTMQQLGAPLTSGSTCAQSEHGPTWLWRSLRPWGCRRTACWMRANSRPSKVAAKQRRYGLASDDTGHSVSPSAFGMNDSTWVLALNFGTATLKYGLFGPQGSTPIVGGTVESPSNAAAGILAVRRAPSRGMERRSPFGIEAGAAPGRQALLRNAGRVGREA